MSYLSAPLQTGILSIFLTAATLLAIVMVAHVHALIIDGIIELLTQCPIIFTHYKPYYSFSS